jgi:hypothetical protein
MADAIPLKLVTGTPNTIKELAATDTTPTANLGTGTADATTFLRGDQAWAIPDIVGDTTPQLGGMLDVNAQAIGDGTRELITFVEDGSAVNQVEIENEATGGGPIIRAAGDDTDVDLVLAGQGAGVPKIGANAILAPTITSGAKGDIAVFDGTDWLNLAAGTNGQYLSADSTAATGLAWVTP